MSGIEDDIELIRELVAWSGESPAAIAREISVANTTINRFANGSANTRLGRSTLQKLKAHYPLFPPFAREAELPAGDPNSGYVSVEVLPTYAGMGGGGTGEGERQYALLPRTLIVDVLGGRPEDFILINTRGDSMVPDFHHDDQVLCDRRDTSPAQPGPFAIWDGDWGEYVLKNVERSTSGSVRIFSSNPKYREEVVPSEQTRIIGRPVWVGRRL